MEIPHSRLFVPQKDETLAADITGLSPGAAAYLNGTYVSSLRDIRRTYQRAFKSLLFAHRFVLSAQRQPHGTSELGYMLGQAPRFAGLSFYRAGDGFTRHAAQFDLDFLPVRDDCRSPGQDARTAPSPRRIQAMFDWWERAFDYTAARAEVHRRCGRQLWHLFEEAQEKQPADPAYLLRHMGADARHWRLDLRYFQGQQAPVYAVTSIDLEDDRWVAARLARGPLAAGAALVLRRRGHRHRAAGPVGIGRSQRRAPGRSRNRQCERRGVREPRLPGERRTAPLRRSRAAQ